MDSVINKLDYVYRGFWKDYGANCVDHLPLGNLIICIFKNNWLIVLFKKKKPVSEGPWSVLGIVALYLWFVKVKGPALMKEREAYNIKSFILVYNIFLVLLHACLFPVA